MAAETVFNWAWKLSTLPTETSTICLDVIAISNNDPLVGWSKCPTADVWEGSSAASQYMMTYKMRHQGEVFRFLLPLESGYVKQSDFLERRLVDCRHIVNVTSFLQPGQHVEASLSARYELMDLPELLPRCYGVIVTEALGNLHFIGDEITKRISISWLSQDPISRKRVGLIGSGSLSKMKGYLSAAAALNIAIIVFDDPKNWLQKNEVNNEVREGLVPLDLTNDSTLRQRITAVLTEYQLSRCKEKRLDGLMTADEHLLTLLSCIAVDLGFYTSPPTAIATAQNKFQTRQLDTNIYCRQVHCRNDLKQLLTCERSQIKYPLIVKPANGWSSEGVWKVNNENELCEKANLLWEDSFTAWHGNEVVIETFVEGPEVDANMVLVDGHVVFFEVNDDFPCSGDFHDGQSNGVANFVETSNMIPSILPASEIESLQVRLHQLAIKAGFRDGILHMEAKLRNSSFHYVKGSNNEDDLIDLRPKRNILSTSTPGDVFLVEINPRAPGWQEIEATARVYGVSYYTLSVLHSLNDKERITALSKPFLGGSQYHMQLLFVSAQRGGLYKYGDVCGAVLSPGPQGFDAQVVKGVNLMVDGQEVCDPRTGQVYGNFIAFFLIASYKGRTEAMRLGREVEKMVRIYTENF